MPLAADLLTWYDRHRRTLPWRAEPGSDRSPHASPYATWVSEIMLQQTRVDTVIPYFERFMARWPTVQDLATAPLDDVLGMWSGLGYYSRARNLHAAAAQVAAAGAFPGDVAGWRALRGVGPYVAGAVASIALGLDVPAVDGNVERVLARVHAHPGGRAAVHELASTLVPTGRAGDFNQALMDLGSAICTSRRPACRDCPISDHCQGRREPESYPVRRKRTPQPLRPAVAAAIVRDGSVLLMRRPTSGRFGGLFDLPGGMLEADEAPSDGLRRLLSQRLGVTAAPGAPLGVVRHTLTHMKIVRHVLRAEISGSPELGHYTAMRWSSPTATGELGLSTLARKALALVNAPQALLPLPPRRDTPEPPDGERR